MICKATTPTRPYLSWLPVSLTMEKSAPAALAAAYNSRNGASVAVFDDNYLGSTLAAATLLNILLPAGIHVKLTFATMSKLTRFCRNSDATTKSRYAAR